MVIGIVAAIGAKIVTDVGATMTGTALSVSQNATKGIGEFAGFLPIIDLYSPELVE